MKNLCRKLIDTLKQKLNLPEDKAQEAVQYVLNFIKGKLPESLHQQIDAALSGKNVQDTISGAAGKLGGMFGNK